MRESLLKIAETIETGSPSGTAWAISTDDLISLMGVPAATFYRALYELKDKIDMTGALQSFDENSVGDLVTVLERFYGTDAEAVLAQSGLFLPHAARIELMEALMQCVDAARESHGTDLETFRAMMGVYGEFGDTVDIYILEYFDRTSLIEDAVDWYGIRHATGIFFETTASRYLESLFSRHILDLRTLLAPVEAELRQWAHENGFLRDDEPWDERRSQASHRTEQTGRLQEALKIFGLRNGAISLEQLKAKYKNLLKQYHPDLNPSGLEHCKRINTSYAYLFRRLAKEEMH